MQSTLYAVHHHFVSLQSDATTLFRWNGFMCAVWAVVFTLYHVCVRRFRTDRKSLEPPPQVNADGGLPGPAVKGEEEKSLLT